MSISLTEIWLFNGAGARFVAGAFSDKDQAVAWVKNNRLTGVLTRCPVGVGVYDWAIDNAFFAPNGPHQSSAEFIQSFTSSRQEHMHFENGEGG
jgi:hypothetical protein